MANLSIVCSHTVNGVSRMHLELLKTRVFKVIHQGALVYLFSSLLYFYHCYYYYYDHCFIKVILRSDAL